MIAKIDLVLYVELSGPEQAEDACNALTTLHTFIADSFPAGEPIGTDVQLWTEATPEELQEQGLE